MYAILNQGLVTALTTETQFNERFLDIIELITGQHTSFRTFDNSLSYVNSTNAPGWVVEHTTVPLDSFGATANISVLLGCDSRVAGKRIYVQLRKVAGCFRGYVAHSWDVATGTPLVIDHCCIGAGVRVDFGWNPWFAYYGQVFLHQSVENMSIKAQQGVLLTHNFPNQITTTQGYVQGLCERTFSAAYEEAVDEIPYAAFTSSAPSVIFNKYNPNTNTYTASFDVNANQGSLNYLNNRSVVPSRDEAGQLVHVLVPLVLNNPLSGWVGGNVSEYSGLYRMEENTLIHPLIHNSAFTHDGKTYRVWQDYFSSANRIYAVEDK